MVGDEAIAPIAGLAVLVGHGEDQNAIDFQYVNHAVGKALEAATADFRSEWMPSLGELLN